MKIVSVIGARPQFIKCAPVSRQIRKDHQEILIHTGQHYDPEMSDIFFKELAIPAPDYHLGVGSATHGKQTGEILEKVEEILLKESPALVLVYGDTNSTLAGALAAAKLHIPVVHVEAGLRSFDRAMPEEINRILTDHISDILFCSTQTAVDNLAREGISRGVYLTGDVMVDALLYNLEIAEQKSRILKRFHLKKKNYVVMTVHRPSNTDNAENMKNILQAAGKITENVVFPVHPRTRSFLVNYGLWHQMAGNIIITEPLGYLDMLHLMHHADRILTDSGGIQKEAYLLKVPCITLRENTEWVETLEGGWNVLTGATKRKITAAARRSRMTLPEQLYSFGDGHAAERMLEVIVRSQRMQNPEKDDASTPDAS
jgi:UDP-N-acetylglucosamine 2-epimerase (non-hydrolysing)